MKKIFFFKTLLRKKWFLLGFFLSSVISFWYLQNLFSFRFVDEEDNLVLGHFLLKGDKLYSELFSHHQPLAYIVSSLIQLIFHPKDIYSLIEIHRIFLVVWSFAWSLLLIARFKAKVILPILLFEVSKFYLLGNLFLSESLAVYPVLFLTLFLFERTSINRKYLFVFLGFLIGFVGLLLAPLWPFLGAYILFLFWFQKLRLIQLGFLLLGIFIPVLICLPFVDLGSYFHNVFYINTRYYIPQSAEEKMPWALLKAVISPLHAFLISTEFQSTGTILKMVGVFFLGSLFILVKNHQWKLLTAVIVLLTLTNIRYYAPGLEYKAGFHLIIWYALFILVSFYFLTYFFQQTKNLSLKYIGIVLGIAALILTSLTSQSLFQQRDKKADFEKNYANPLIFGQTIHAMRNQGDRLFVIPDEWLLYFAGGVDHSNRMVNFYSWMSLVWELNDPVVEDFKTNPPEFFYCDCYEAVVSTYSENYRQLMRNGAKTSLWVHNAKFSSLDDRQKSELRKLNFQLE